MKEEYMCKEKVAIDFGKGKELLKGIGNSITIFGSARTEEDTEDTLKAEELAYKLANKNFNIISGGGLGIMRAANKGAYNAKNPNIESIGLGINIKNEDVSNPYTTKSLEFNYFFSRKYMLVKYSKACVVFPGGFGTLDELFEVLTLIQTEKLENFEVFLYGTEYWEYLIKFMHKSLLKNNMIKKEDIEKITVTDDIDLIVKSIEVTI